MNSACNLFGRKYKTESKNKWRSDKNLNKVNKLGGSCKQNSMLYDTEYVLISQIRFSDQTQVEIKIQI